jgi:hypothetical protein
MYIIFQNDRLKLALDKLNNSKTSRARIKQGSFTG